MTKSFNINRQLYGVCVNVISLLIAGVVGWIYIGAYVILCGFPLPPHPSFVVPGQHEVQLSDTGVYYLYHEYKSRQLDKRHWNSAANEQLDVSVIAVKSGDTVLTSPPATPFTYSFPSGEGKSIAALQVDKPGVYRLSVNYADPTNDSPTVVALGRPVTYLWLALPVGVLFIATLIAANMLLRKYIRQGRILPSLRKLRYGDSVSS